MIEQGYFITKDGNVVHAENWYDECSSSYEFEGLHIYSNNRDLCSHGQGKNISSLDSLFRCLLSENQFNIKKLAERIGDDLKDSLDAEYRNKAIKNLDEDVLKEAIYEWSTCVDIPGYVFTDKSLFAENFPTYYMTISIRNYSSAGDYFYDKMSDTSDDVPDEVFWIDRKTFEEWGTPEDRRDEVFDDMRKTFEDWANGRVYGVSYQEWQEDKLCWADEEHVGGFIGESFYSLEKILADALCPVETADNLKDANEKTGCHAFDPSLNDGVLYERARVQAELDKQPKLFTDEELAECQNSK